MVLLVVPGLLVVVYTTRQAIDATAGLESVLKDPQKALPLHAVDWIRHQLPRRWQAAGFSQPLRQGAEQLAAFFASRFGALVRNLFAFFPDLFIFFFALFFIFRAVPEFVRGPSHLSAFA